MDLVADMKAGKVGAIIMSGVNPLYTLPNASDFAEGLKKTELSVAFSMKEDETSSETQYIAAAPHYLESWGDVEIKKGHYSLTQPTIRPLFNTRQFQEALLKWTGNDMSYHDYIKDTWGTDILNGSSFNQALHDGIFVGTIATETEDTTVATENAEMPSGDAARTLVASVKPSALELTLYTKIGMGDGHKPITLGYKNFQIQLPEHLGITI